MKIMRFAKQYTHAFSFENFATKNKVNTAKTFLCYCKKRIDETFSWSALLKTIEIVP